MQVINFNKQVKKTLADTARVTQLASQNFPHVKLWLMCFWLLLMVKIYLERSADTDCFVQMPLVYCLLFFVNIVKIQIVGQVQLIKVITVSQFHFFILYSRFHTIFVRHCASLFFGRLLCYYYQHLLKLLSYQNTGSQSMWIPDC